MSDGHQKTSSKNALFRTCKPPLFLSLIIFCSFFELAASVHGATTAQLTANRSGNGSGGLSSSTLGVSCTHGLCSGQLNVGSSAIIVATHSADSYFNGWSGCDSVIESSCTVVMDSDRIVTASFQEYPVKRVSSADFYSMKIQDAFDSASSEDIIESQSTFFNENLFFSRNASIGLKGGYSLGFGGNPDFTTINGSMTISDGSVTVEKVAITGVGSCNPVGGPFGGGEVTVAGGSVTATVVDQTGAPVTGQPTFICGLNLCTTQATTNAQGHVAITTALQMKKPAFRFGDAITYAKFAIPLTHATTSFGTLAIGKMPSTGPTLTPGTEATSGDVTISLAPNSTVLIDTLTYDTPQMQELRTVNIPVNKASAVLNSAPATNFALLYGITPTNTLVCPPAKVTIALPHLSKTPNDLDWPPGAAVEFWITSDDVSQTYTPYAGWTKISDGIVSPDGTTVSTVAGQGFNILLNFAVRLK